MSQTGTPSDTATGGTPAPSVQPPSGAAVDAAVQGGAGAAGAGESQSSGAGSVDLDQLKQMIAASPQAREMLEREFVKPAISKVEFNRKKLEDDIRQQIANEGHQQKVAALQTQANASDEATRTRALVELGKLGLQQYGQQTEQAQKQELQRAIVRDLAENIFGVDMSTLPAEATASNEALGKWLVQNSRLGKEQVNALVAQAGQDASTVQAATQTASFASRLANTPSPTFGSDGAPAGGVQRPLTQGEFDQNRGDVRWLKDNLPRMRSAVDSGAITR